MTAIGTRALKDQLSRCLKRVHQGERLVVTARGKAVAILSPVSTRGPDRRIEAMLRDGVARLGGAASRGAPADRRGSGAGASRRR